MQIFKCKIINPIHKLSLFCIALFMCCQGVNSQNYDVNLSGLDPNYIGPFSYSAEGLPDALPCENAAGASLLHDPCNNVICDDPGLTYQNLIAALDDIPNDGYHFMEFDFDPDSLTYETNNFTISYVDNEIGQNFPSVNIWYYYHLGLPTQGRRLLKSETINGDGTLNIEFTPRVGSHEGAIVIDAGYRNRYILPLVVAGPVYTEVDVLGTFTTPQIPYLILHDPPGDKSFAKSLKGTTICRESSFALRSSSTNAFDITFSMGIKGSVGAILVQDFEVSTSFARGFSMTSSSSNSSSVEICTTIETEYSTSDGGDQSLIGEEADIFIGYGELLSWGFFDVIKWSDEACSEIIIEKELVFARETNSDGSPITNTFVKTARAIRDDIVAQQAKVDDSSLSLKQRTAAASQIKVWNDVLAINQNNLNNPQDLLVESAGVNSWDIDGSAGPITRRRDVTTTQSFTMEFEVATEQNTEIGSVAMVGANGKTSGTTFSMERTYGTSISSGVQESEIFEYTLDDEDTDFDNFFIDVYRDPMYGTHIFKLKNTSKTSCPYEGGIRKDQPQVSFDNPNCSLNTAEDFLELVAPVEKITIDLKLCNLYNDDNDDNDGDTRRYLLDILRNSSNVEIKAGGNILSPGDPAQVQLAGGYCDENYKVSIDPKGISGTQEIVFLFYPKCGDFGQDSGNPQSSEADTAILKITFDSELVSGAEPDTLCIDYTLDNDLDGIPNTIDSCASERDISLDFDPDDPFDPESILHDHIEVPHNADFTLEGRENDISFEAWVYRTNSGQHTILSKGHGGNSETNYIFSIMSNANQDASGRLGLWLAGEWQYGNTKIPLYKWTHIAASVDAASDDNPSYSIIIGVNGAPNTEVLLGYSPAVTFYVNGVEDGSLVYSSSTLQKNIYSDDTRPLYIGQQGYNCACFPFEGRLDDLAIWKKRLTQADIDDSSTGRSLTGLESGLVAAYDFNDADACVDNSINTTLFDKKGNHDGTLINFDLSDEACTSNWTSGKNIDPSPCICPESVDADADKLSDCVDLCPEERDASLHFEDRGGIASDYIEVPHEDDFSLLGKDFAFEAWVNPSSGDYKTIVSKGHGSNAETNYIFGIMADDDTFFGEPGKLGLSLTDGSFNVSEWQFSASSIAQDVWTHVAVSVDISGATPVASFYVNGELDVVRTFSGNISSVFLNNSDTNPLYIGRQGYGCQCNHFDGRIDELALWQKQLTLADVQSSMAAPYVGIESGLKAYFDFNDNDACVSNSNTTLIDKANNHDGTLVNFALRSNCISNWASGHNVGACGSPCPPDMDLTGSLDMDGSYTSASYISSNQVIGATNSNITVDYKATTEISLLEEFEIKVGAIFQAFLEACGGL